MKKILTVSLLVCIAGMFTVSAQNKGDMYVSGSISMSGSNTKDIMGDISEKTPMGFAMSIAPQFGIFVADNFDVHLGLEYSFISSPYSSGDTENYSVFSIAPGVSYYLNILDNKLFYAPGLDLAVGFGAVNDKYEGKKEKTAGITIFEVSLSLLSFEFRPVENFGISFRAGDLTYRFNQLKYTDVSLGEFKTNVNSFDFGFNFNAAIGFRYYF